MTECCGCGRDVAYKGRGRPRSACETCLPPVEVIGSAEYGRRWRALNPERVAAQDLARRERYWEKRAADTRAASAILNGLA